MKMTFTNIVIYYSGCGCCGDDGVYISETGPIVVESPNEEVSVWEHAKIAFGPNVVHYDCKVDN